MRKMVIIGGGGHAKVLISVLKRKEEFTIIGYTDRKDNGTILGIPYLGTDDALNAILSDNPSCSAAIGIGGVIISERRKEIVRKLESIGFDLPPITSRGAIVNECVEMGQGTVVFDGAVINSGTVIGQYSILNTNSTVDHDCRIGDYVHIAPGVTISGDTRIGNNAFIGAGATIIQGITIAEDCLIGAGAVVVDDCLIPGTYVGVPARRMK